MVDDQTDIRTALALLLKSHGYQARVLASPAQALAEVARERYDLVLMDLNYARDTTSGGEGLDLLGRLRAVDPALPIAAMTAWSTVPLAVAVLRGGGFDFVEKPWDNVRLLEIVEAQVAAGRARRLARRLEDDARDVQGRIPGGAAPEAPGYDIGAAWRFAGSLGGDAYEVAPLSGGRLNVAIADVCGKGLPAALLMASLRATLEEAAAAELPPREACRRIAAQMPSRLSTEADRLFVDLTPHWRMFAFTAALGVGTCVLFGLALALRATDLASGAVMKAAGRGLTDTRERFGLRRVLVVTQVALSLVLVGGALQQDYPNFNRVSPGYFPLMETPVLAGREFDERDRATSVPVAIVNESFARKYFPGSKRSAGPSRSVSRRARRARSTRSSGS